MNTTEILTVIAIFGTIWGFLIGYRTANVINRRREEKWWAEMTYEDQVSETPIYNKLSREYGYLQ